jgi:hypothetical protein
MFKPHPSDLKVIGVEFGRKITNLYGYISHFISKISYLNGILREKLFVKQSWT